MASADTRFSVATPALNELNKFCTTLDWFDPKMPMPLYSLFLGNGSKIPDKKTSAVSPRVKIKILNHLLKCRGNAINVAKGVQVIFEGLFGELTNQKCKVAALQFATNVISNGQPDIIEKLSKVFQTSISKLIGPDSQEPTDVQNAAYQALAKLIAICPDTFNRDVKFIVDYFNCLTSSPPELHNPIRECMVALAQAFKWDPSKQKDEPMELDEDGVAEKKKFIEKFVATSNHLLILGVLKDQCESNLPIARNIASLFLTTCFPSYFVPARYLLIVLAGTCSQLKETIYGYLYGSQRKDHVNYTKLISCDRVDDDADEKILLNDQMIILPAIKPLIHYIDQLADKKVSGSTSGAHKIAFHVDVFTEILDYMHLCLWFSAGCSGEPGNDNEMHVLREYIESLENSGNVEHIEKFTRLIRNILVVKKGMTELSCLTSLLIAAPSVITKNNLDLRVILTPSLKEVNEGIRILIAKIYGILLAYGSDEKTFNDEISNLLKNSQKSLEHHHGSVLALSNALFYRILNTRQSKNHAAFSQLLSSAEIRNSVKYLVKLLTDPKSLLTLAAIKGLSLLGCSIRLPLDETEENEDTSMEVDDNERSKNYLFKTLVQLLKSSQTKQKVREDSAHCLGHLCIGDAAFFGKRVASGFLELKKATKDAAIHIAIAQGLVFTVAGDENLPKEIPHVFNDELLEWLLSEMIKIVPEVNVCSRQAISLWLLAVVKACASRDPVISRKRTIQMAFTHLLSEDNELVQDVASRGLGIIYSMSSESDQAELSTLLLEQLTDGNKGKVRKVDEDSVIFEEGVLGKAPTGANLSTYKELCGLASDLNQPEIIYSFMQLANSNASWNSRLGAAFGLQSISGVAKVKMEPYLSKIVPRLFRCKLN